MEENEKIRDLTICEQRTAVGKHVAGNCDYREGLDGTEDIKKSELVCRRSISLSISVASMTKRRNIALWFFCATLSPASVT